MAGNRSFTDYVRRVYNELYRLEIYVEENVIAWI